MNKTEPTRELSIAELDTVAGGANQPYAAVDKCVPRIDVVLMDDKSDQGGVLQGARLR